MVVRNGSYQHADAADMINSVASPPERPLSAPIIIDGTVDESIPIIVGMILRVGPALRPPVLIMFELSLSMPKYVSTLYFYVIHALGTMLTSFAQ